MRARRRSKRRWTGRYRKFAAGAVRVAAHFPGADVVLEQLERGAPRCRVGLKPRGRAPVRAGVLLYADASASQSVGAVTSGTFGPSAAGPVAMGYVPRALSRPTTLLFADVRGNRLPVEVTELPFVPHRYKRIERGAILQC